MIRTLFLSLIATLGLSTIASAEIKRFSKDPTLQKQANLVQMSIILDASISRVWKLVGEDFDKSEFFNPEAATANYIKGNTAKVGTIRRTIGSDLKFIDVEIYRYSKTNHIVSWEIIATDLAPISFGFSEYRLEAISAEKTRLIQVSGFKMSNGFLDTAMRFRFPTLLRTELAGIKNFVENGEPITPATARKIRNRFGGGITTKKNW